MKEGFTIVKVHLVYGVRSTASNHRIMFMFDRGKLRGYRKKSDKEDQAFRIKSTEPENDQIKYQACGHCQRAAGDQLMPLGLCHGAPPAVLTYLRMQTKRKRPTFGILIYGTILS